MPAAPRRHVWLVALPLQLTAWALCAVQAVAGVHKAVTFAPAGEVVSLPIAGEVAIYRWLLGGAAVAAAVGVGLLAHLASALWDAPRPVRKGRRGERREGVGERGWAVVVILLWLGLAVTEQQLALHALADARAGVEVEQGLGALRRELRTVQQRLGRDGKVLATLKSEDLASEDEAVRARARRLAQVAVGLEADADWGPETQARVDARLAELEERVPADEAREEELGDAIAAARRDVAPDAAPWVISILIEVYVCVVTFACARAMASAPPPRAAKATGRKAKAAAPATAAVTVPAHGRSNAPNGVKAHTRAPRGAAAKRAPAAAPPATLWGQLRARLGGRP